MLRIFEHVRGALQTKEHIAGVRKALSRRASLQGGDDEQGYGLRFFENVRSVRTKEQYITTITTYNNNDIQNMNNAITISIKC